MGAGKLRSRAAPESLSAIEKGYRRLQQGLAVAHTPQGSDTLLSIAATDLDNRLIDVALPDYAGEDLRRLVDDRRIHDRWHKEAGSGDQWLLLIRLSRHPQLPDVLTRPIGELATASFAPDNDDAHTLPVDMWAVELLQALLYARRTGMGRSTPLPRLTLVLSCWDELDVAKGVRPAEIAGERLALLDSYCRSTWNSLFDVVGLSSQGRSLDESAPAPDFLDAGPQQMGWIITEAGIEDGDLTLLIGPR